MCDLHPAAADPVESLRRGVAALKAEKVDAIVAAPAAKRLMTPLDSRGALIDYLLEQGVID